MKFSIFPKFGALNSKPVFDAFVEGARKLKFQVTEHDMSADVYVIWSVLWQGRMSKNKEVWDQAKKLGKNVSYEIKNTLTITIEQTDLLFIDTFHNYDQVLQELRLHAKHVNKFIVFHEHLFTFLKI